MDRCALIMRGGGGGKHIARLPNTLNCRTRSTDDIRPLHPLAKSQHTVRHEGKSD
eukprot:COSAG01_NODE_10093_length_2252_cov_1.667441_2_plen_55_part_00